MKSGTAVRRLMSLFLTFEIPFIDAPYLQRKRLLCSSFIIYGTRTRNKLR